MIYIDPMNRLNHGSSASGNHQPRRHRQPRLLLRRTGDRERPVDKGSWTPTAVGYDRDTMPGKESAKRVEQVLQDYIMGTGYDMVEKTPKWYPHLRHLAPTASRSWRPRSALPNRWPSCRGWRRNAAATAS